METKKELLKSAEMTITLDDLFYLALHETEWDGNDSENNRPQIVDLLQTRLIISSLVEITMDYFPFTIRCRISNSTGLKCEIKLSRPIRFTESEADFWHYCAEFICYRVNYDVPISTLPRIMRMWDHSQNQHLDPTTLTLRSTQEASWLERSTVATWCGLFLLQKGSSKEHTIVHFLKKQALWEDDDLFHRCGFHFSTSQDMQSDLFVIN